MPALVQSTVQLVIRISNRNSLAFVFKKLTPTDPGRHLAIIRTDHPSIEALLDEAGIKPSTKDASAMVGRLLAEKIKAHDITTVALNRKHDMRYHGKVKAVIDALRESGVAVH